MRRQLTQGIGVLLAFGLLVGAVFYLRQQLPPPGAGGPPAAEGPAAAGAPPPSAATATSTIAPDVAVVTATPGNYTAQVQGYGTAQPHYQLTLTAQVAGQVTTVAAALASGRQVASGATLLQIDDGDYRAAVASAEAALAQAQLALLEEEREGAQARAEWRASGMQGEPDSALVLRAPQLAVAKAAVNQARAELATARRDLARTQVSAPYDALVVARLVAPGSYVQLGSELATLYSTDQMEIAIPLAAHAWQQLPAEAQLTAGDWPVTLVGVEDGRQWQGRVVRSEQHLDETTRQRVLVVAVDGPLAATPPLLPGAFLAAQVAGRSEEGLWQLPSSALSQRGEIWYVDGDNSLRSFAATPRFSREQAIFIAPPAALAASAQRVVIHPLNGYLQGMAVHPVAEVDHE